MSDPGTFLTTLLALVAFKFIEPWVEVLRNWVMGWNSEEADAAQQDEHPGARREH